MKQEEQVLSNCVGGPVFVQIKEGRVIRVHPIMIGPDDEESWMIK